MGQEVRGVSEAPPLTAEEASGRGIGRYLAAQRQLRGISLDELASLTKIPLRSLERLETGAFDLHPDGFVRGFVRTVAAALGLDPDETVMRMLREPAEDEAAGPPGARAERRVLVLRAFALVGLLLALAGLGGLLAAWLRPAPAAEDAPVILRRDPVRELVREEAQSADEVAPP